MVTDGEQRSALACVRSLGRAGYRVIVCSASRRPLSGASRHCAAEGAVADPLQTPARFTDDVVELARKYDARWVLPVTDAALLALVPHRARFGDARIPFADEPTIRALADKEAVLRAAASLGMAVPEQRVLHDPDATLDASGPEYPVVLKPYRSVTDAGAERRKHSVHHAADASELRARLRDLDDSAFPILAQRRILGPGIGVCLLMHHGRVIAQFAHRRLRETPPAGGVSVYAESIKADETLVAQSVALLRHFQWEGPAMVEYKVDAQTGRAYLMEVNGRFWGSMQLAVDSGVDFPRLLLEVHAGATPDPVTTYRAGVRERWWLGDLSHLLARIRRSPAELALPPGAPPRWKAILDFLRHRRGDRSDVLRREDPWPFLRELAAWVRDR